MPYLDTNCLARWFLDDVPGAADKVEKLIAAKPGIIVDDVVLIETIFLLESVMKLTRKTICGFLEALNNYPVQFDRKLWEDILPIWLSHPKLSVVDIYLVAKAAQRKQEPVYTFDVKMHKQLPGAVPIPWSAGRLHFWAPVLDKSPSTYCRYAGISATSLSGHICSDRTLTAAPRFLQSVSGASEHLHKFDFMI